MNSKKITSVIALVFLGLFLASCGSPKACSKRGKTRVPMGHM